MDHTRQAPTGTAVTAGSVSADPILPCSIQGIRAIIAAAITRGVSLGCELEPEITAIYRRCGATVGPKDWASCDAQVDQVVAQLMQAAAQKLPAYCHPKAPAAHYIAIGIRAGLLRGMEAYLEYMIAEDTGRPLEDWCALMPADPEWVLNASNRFMSMLLGVLDSIGIPVPGATAMLLQEQAESSFGRPVRSWQTSTGRWEARSACLPNPAGLPYQWALQRSGDRVQLARRSVGAEVFEPVGTYRLEDVAPLADLFAAACRSGMEID